MYPFIRLTYQMWKVRKAPRLSLTETHVSHHICWPWDLDFWNELNNGRTLTFFDMGRIPLAQRIGMIGVLKERKWALTIAGGSVRFRKRVRAFQRLTIKSRGLGWDDKFMYLEHAMYNQAGECTSHILMRSAITDHNGIVAPHLMAKALGHDAPSPDLPQWVVAWTEADSHRPWPPEFD